jgi:hypothetical protein
MDAPHPQHTLMTPMQSALLVQARISASVGGSGSGCESSSQPSATTSSAKKADFQVMVEW